MLYGVSEMLDTFPASAERAEIEDHVRQVADLVRELLELEEE